MQAEMWQEGSSLCKLHGKMSLGSEESEEKMHCGRVVGICRGIGEETVLGMPREPLCKLTLHTGVVA